MVPTTGLPTGFRPGRADMPSVEKFIKDGLDPVHAAYAFIQHITSYFAEGVSNLPEMKKYAEIIIKAEDEYLPSSPPVSPLTHSFFTTWALYDLEFDGSDTLATCLIDANDLVGLNPDQLKMMRSLATSRMGVYEHIGVEGPFVRLRELVTDAEFVCHVAAGYSGKPGELWYVRLLPPAFPEAANYHIVFTTPYILVKTSKDDWTQFLRRKTSQSNGVRNQDALHRFLKHGSTPNYWNEFVFQGYHHHQGNAIFLAGIPDLRTTLPHA